MSLRFVFALTVKKKMKVKHLDVEITFLNGKLDKEIYINQEGYIDQKNPEKVCKLLKALWIEIGE